MKIAEEIVDKIIEDFTDRAGLENEWENIDEDIREEIKKTWIKKVTKILKDWQRYDDQYDDPSTLE